MPTKDLEGGELYVLINGEQQKVNWINFGSITKSTTQGIYYSLFTRIKLWFTMTKLWLSVKYNKHDWKFELMQKPDGYTTDLVFIDENTFVNINELLKETK